MHRNMSVLIVLTVIMTTATVTFNSQAQIVPISTRARCSWLCCFFRPCPPHLPPAPTLEARIRKGERTVDNYITLGWLYSQNKNFSLAEARYRTALEIATTAKDKQGEARAYAALGYLYADTNKPDKAVFNFKQSRDKLVSLGYTKHADEIQQQIQKLRQPFLRQVVPLN
ncbi:MAG: hypothetical protein Fur006_09720 [Coleofasciculaceae cyanobacterium]